MYCATLQCQNTAICFSRFFAFFHWQIYQSYIFRFKKKKLPQCLLTLYSSASYLVLSPVKKYIFLPDSSRDSAFWSWSIWSCWSLNSLANKKICLWGSGMKRKVQGIVQTKTIVSDLLLTLMSIEALGTLSNTHDHSWVSEVKNSTQ